MLTYQGVAPTTTTRIEVRMSFNIFYIAPQWEDSYSVRKPIGINPGENIERGENVERNEKQNR